MHYAGIHSNIMSLGGIAIAIGVLVDAGIVMTENVIRHCEEAERVAGRRLTAGETMDCTRAAAAQVGRPIVFAMAIIILAFLPIFTFQRVEGKIFSPMAYTLSFALFGAIVLTLRHKAGVKRQNISAQNARTRETAIDVVKVQPGQGL